MIEPKESIIRPEKVTRVEIINQFGRQFVTHRAKHVEIHFQDDNRTIKIFLTDENLGSK